MSTFLVVCAAGLGTYLLRASLVALPDSSAPPAWLTERLGLIGPAVMAAIVASALTGSGGGVPIPVEVLAVAVAFVTVRKLGNPGWALVAGLPAYWLATTITSWLG
jgi:branched-subunit amino acid transport protein